MTSLLDNSDDSSGSDSSISDLSDLGDHFSMDTAGTSMASTANPSPTNFKDKLQSWMVGNGTLPQLNADHFSLSSADSSSSEGEDYVSSTLGVKAHMPRFHMDDDHLDGYVAGSASTQTFHLNLEPQTGDGERFSMKSSIDDEVFRLNPSQGFPTHDKPTQSIGFEIELHTSELTQKLEAVAEARNRRPIVLNEQQVISARKPAEALHGGTSAFSPVQFQMHATTDKNTMLTPTANRQSPNFDDFNNEVYLKSSNVVDKLSSQLKAEKSNLSEAIKLIKHKVHELKLEYPEKPRPPSINATLKSMAENLKTHRFRLQKVFDMEKKMFEGFNSSEASSDMDDEVDVLDLSASLDQVSGAKGNRKEKHPVETPKTEKQRLATQIDGLAKRLRTLDGGDQILKNIEARSVKKDKTGGGIFGCCGGGK